MAIALMAGWIYDGIVASLEIVSSCSDLMTFGRVFARGTGVSAVSAKAMCPTVVHGNAIVGCNVEIPTLLGKANLKVPPYTHPGQTFRGKARHRG